MVDDEDYEELSKFKWYVNVDKKSKRAYAHRQYRRSDQKQILVTMHRQIMNAPKNKYVDHRDRNGLNNQRYNLRFCTHGQNMSNQRRRYQKGKLKQYKGVVRAGNKWRVYINANGVRHELGSYTCQKAAAREYDKLAKILHGEFACLNFPEKIF